MRYANLRNWLKLWGVNNKVKLSGGGKRVKDVFLWLQDFYSGSHRFYHTLEHIDHCLRELMLWDRFCKNPALDHLAFALWFHDVIYNPRAKDNEEKSADFAGRIMKEVDSGMSDEFIKIVQELILATKHVELPRGFGKQLIADIDLSSLGSSGEVFDANRQAIRKEYVHLSDEKFEKGNQAFLKTLLARPLIFSVPYFQNKYEVQARQNIVRVLGR